jgi:hypothetical protein
LDKEAAPDQPIRRGVYMMLTIQRAEGGFGAN